MYQKIKDSYGNFRRHKKLFALLFILMALCARMFTQNYQFQSPIISKHQPSYNDLLGEVAAFQSQAAITTNDAAMQTNNPDLYR